MRRDELHAAVAALRVCVPHAARELHELADVPDEQRTAEAERTAMLQRVADEIAGQNGGARVEADGRADEIRAIVARREQDIVRAVRPALPQLDMDGVDEGLLAHRLDDAGRTEDGNAADNAEAGVEGLFLRAPRPPAQRS